MDYFIQLLVSGIAAGLVYGFIGMGFAMIFRATGVVNFAQGELMMLAAYIGFTLVGTFQLGFWPLLLASITVSVLIGLLVEVLLIRPMLGQPVFSTVMVTIGLAVIIRSVVVLVWGFWTADVPPTTGDGGNRLYIGSGPRPISRTPGRLPLLHSRHGSLAEARARPGLCRAAAGPHAGCRPSRAHAIAHLYPDGKVS